jgi:hypothetical protein
VINLLQIATREPTEQQRATANDLELTLVADNGSRSTRWIKRDALRRAQQDPELYAAIATAVQDLINSY